MRRTVAILVEEQRLFGKVTETIGGGGPVATALEKQANIGGLQKPNV
jgi:hypothetical protein